MANENKNAVPGAPGGEAAGGGKRRRRGGGGEKGEGGGENRERRRRDSDNEEREELDERPVDITRVAKVIKGGRRFAFRTVVIVGDNKGRIGVGIGKARAVPDSIRKGTDRAKRVMVHVAMSGNTIPHDVVGEYGGAKVLLRPATPGTGIIAGGGVRAVLEATGYKDVLTKSQGSNNLLNVVMATWAALRELRTPEQLAAMRGKSVDEMRPFWERAAHASQVTEVRGE
jgi:small subunit ribosomal protein S5